MMSSPLSPSALRFPLVALAAPAITLGHALILIRVANIAAPLYASDEMAYWHSARALFAGVDRRAFNIYLQQVNCDLFYLMVGWLAERPDGALVMRLFNYIMLVLTASLVYGAARSVTSRSWSAVAAALVFVTGPSVWLVSTMPETTYAFFFALLVLVLVRIWSRGAPGSSLLVGVLTGAMILIKPHGIAIALACIATMLAVPLLIQRNTRSLVIGAIDILMLAAGVVLSVVVISSLATGQLVLSPSRLIGPLYGNILSSSNPRSFVRLLETMHYYLAHGIVLAMLFAPALVFSVRLVAKSLYAGGRTAPQQGQTIILVIFTAF